MNPNRVVLICLLLFVIALWLRLPGLDRFLTPDEVVWANGAVKYLDAVRDHDWAATNISGHPGVTTTWAGAVGLGARWLLARSEETATFSDYLAWVASDPIRPALLPWLRAPIAVLCALGIVALYLLARRLLGEKAALLAAGLISLDPFLLAHGRLLQMDGLLATAIAVAWLALLVATRTGARRFYMFSGLSIGFAALTKSPALVMGPLMLGWIVLTRWRSPDPLPRRAGRVGIDLLWVGVPAVLLVFLLWPALWIEPLAALGRVWRLMTVYSGGGHELGNYWLGKPVSQPGTSFYVAVLALRTTPVTLVGMALLGVRFDKLSARLTRQGSRFDRLSARAETTTERRTVAALLVFILWFGVILSLGAKKFDRYLLPIFPAVDLLAAMGWVAAFRWIIGLRSKRSQGGSQERPRRAARPELVEWIAPTVGLVLLMGIQAWMALVNRPSYLTAYNPLVGGIRVAERTMLVGWGEGLAEAATFLNGQPGAADAHVAAWYGKNVFAAFYDGESFDLHYDTPTAEDLFVNDVDYVVTYVNQVQRDLVDPSVDERLGAPLYIVSYGDLGDFPGNTGVPWASVYAWPKAFVHTADHVLGDGLRLLGWQVGDHDRAAGVIPVTLYWDAATLKAISERRFLIWMKDATGEVWTTAEEVIRLDGGENVVGWLGQPVTASSFILRLPVGLPSGTYRVEMAPFAGQGSELTELDIQATRLAEVGSFGPDVQMPIGEVRFGNEVQLVGHVLMKTSDAWVLDLLWTSLAPSGEPRHYFVHVVEGGDQDASQIVAQADGPLVRFGTAGELVRQRVRLSPPDDGSQASYRIYIGVYQPADGVRLPLTVDGEQVPDGRYLLSSGP